MPPFVLIVQRIHKAIVLTIYLSCSSNITLFLRIGSKVRNYKIIQKKVNIFVDNMIYY